jgi:ABC-type branched-subunit amino acid transport system substrate-binding protein
MRESQEIESFRLALPSHAAEPIRIGGLFAVTGPPSFLGEAERNTAQMAVAKIYKHLQKGKINQVAILTVSDSFGSLAMKLLVQNAQYVLSGLSTGAIYALIGIGFAIVYNSTGIINFAQGEFVMLGGMLIIFF